MTQEINDVRQRLADEMIREMNAEIDRDTIRRFNNGERLIRTETGPEWVYVVDENGKMITDPDRLKNLLGHLMY
jgi:hypothetical protein